MEKTTKLSLEELKAKAGKAFVDAHAISGGTLDDCHVVAPSGPAGPVCDQI
ncbi:MAG TPA: hypothetical protein VL832_17495 [Puia sp.]|nr:hypothetical protein [Puia sp.]